MLLHCSCTMAVELDADDDDEGLGLISGRAYDPVPALGPPALNHRLSLQLTQNSPSIAQQAEVRPYGRNHITTLP
ncbi:unnamed protein product [Pieris brassicae]|uniref:Uncharacterized protein n=1 Tax=Pieris brassicae TaxID=7116 RepID=A0A9P0TSB2_PIEBR|nr:unnamed protein product [Pieris brassicae]